MLQISLSRGPLQKLANCLPTRLDAVFFQQLRHDLILRTPSPRPIAYLGFDVAQFITALALRLRGSRELRTLHHLTRGLFATDSTTPQQTQLTFRRRLRRRILACGAGLHER